MESGERDYFYFDFENNMAVYGNKYSGRQKLESK
jgi:hypothetical protein